MKKIIKGTVIVILLLFLIFYGFSKYRQSVSYQDAIHKDADVIIKVSVDQLLKKIVVNAIKNSSYYSKLDEKDSVKEGENKNKFKVQYPANIFAYNLKSKPNTFFTTLKINDTIRIKYFLKNKFRIESFEDEKNYTKGASKNKKVQVAYTNKKLVVSYSFENENALKTMEALLFDEKVMSTDSKKIADLKKSEGDVVITNKNNNLEVNFNNGAVALKGNLDLKEYLEIPSKVKVENLSLNSGIRMWLAGDVKYRSVKNPVINGFTMPLDSLLYNYNGFVDINISGHTTQIDTIVAYEYNDDFEKVESKSLQEKVVPGITVLAKGNAGEIRKLLENERIITNEKINREIVPLYEFNVSKIDSTRLLIRNVSSDYKSEIIETNEFFHLYINFNTLLEQSSFSIISDYIKNMDELNIVATKNNKKGKVEGELLLKNESINAAVQLFEN